MRDLVRIADDDLKELTPGQRLRMAGAISIAIACGIVALQGMAVFFADTKVVQLPGTHQLPGQIAWATALVAMLAAVTILVRGVIQRRLQWAIAISLLIHFVLCLSVSVVKFNGRFPIPAAAAEFDAATPEEFTLLDYAGEEMSDSDAVWQHQSDAPAPDNDVEVERAEMEIAEANKPQPVDVTQAPAVEKLEPMQRQEQVNLTAEAAAEMERQATMSELPTPQPADAPDVATADSLQPLLDVQMNQAKQSSEAPTSEREQTEIASADQQLESAELQAQRADAVSKPEDVQASMAPKSNAEPEAATAASEDVSVATSDAQQMNVTELKIDIARQQAGAASGSVGEPQMNNVPASSARADISPARSERAAGIGYPSAAAPATGGEVSMARRSAEANADAVGTTANEIGVAAAIRSGTKNGDAMSAGPAGTSVGRSTNGLPSRSNSNGTVSGPSGPASSAATQSGPIRSSSAAVAGRGREPSAMLKPDAGFAGGTNPGRPMSRSSAAITSLPAGAAAAEQSGTLVIAGPQATAIGGAMASNGLAGPRMNSVPRRTAGLPGSNGPAAAAGAPSGSNDSQPARVAVGSLRAGIGNSEPTLASADVVAGMIKKSVPGLGGSPEARIAESLSMRTADARREAARTLGGSPESEEAVEQGLVWLALNQYPDGHWSLDDFPGTPPADIGQGSFRADSAATGLALLAYLGAGYTHRSGKYQDVVNRGVTWLLKRQKPDGDLFADESEFVWFYSHGIASIALCEGYGLTKDVALKEPAQRALNFIVDSQHPEFGGWRYRPRFESDTSVSGWQLMALKSGEMSGLIVPKDAYVRVGKWLDSVQSKTSSGQFSYHPTRDASPTMTAEALLMRQYLGAKRNDAQLIAGANFLRTRLPDFGQRDSYYWYYATQVMFHMQGEYWSAWNNSLRDSLLETQSKDGSISGSWDPARPTPEKWSKAGGRHYVTCLNLLMLEVYYRHLPLYLELEK